MSVVQTRKKDDAKRRALKAKLARTLVAELKATGKNGRQLAQVLHTTQPRVHTLMSGEFSLFSIDMLIRFSLHLGLNVEINLGEVYENHRLEQS